MKALSQDIQAFFASHPGLKNFLEGLLQVALVAAATFILKGENPDNATPITLAGIGAAVFAAIKVYAQHAFDSYVLASQGQTPVAQLMATRAKAAASGEKVMNSNLKAILLLAGLAGLLASTANAGYIIANPRIENVGLTLPSGTDLYLMPIEGFQVGANLPNPTYGFSLNEDLVWGSLSSAADGSTNLAPIFGLGASLYFDMAGVVNNNGPLQLLGGVNAVGPDLDLLGLGNGQGLVPDILLVKNFDTGETKVTGGLTVFADLGPGTAVKVTGH